MARKISFLIDTPGSPAIDPGRRRHVITILANEVGSPPIFDAAGLKLQQRTVLSTWAAIENFSPIRGDIIQGGQTTSELYVAIGIIWQPGIVGGMLVVSDTGSTYIIQSVEDVQDAQTVLILSCLGLGANV